MQIFNIKENLVFNTEKPAVYSILKTDKTNILSIGLNQNQLLTKHKAHIQTYLTVLLGGLEFKLPDQTINLKEFDVFKIPVGIEHEVIGIGIKNIFTLTQEKN